MVRIQRCCVQGALQTRAHTYGGGGLADLGLDHCERSSLESLIIPELKAGREIFEVGVGVGLKVLGKSTDVEGGGRALVIILTFSI